MTRDEIEKEELRFRLAQNMESMSTLERAFHLFIEDCLKKENNNYDPEKLSSDATTIMFQYYLKVSKTNGK